MRTLGQLAFILPDTDKKKSYFQEKVKNNIDYYNANLTDNPNAPMPGWTNIGYGGGLGYKNAKGANVGMSSWMDHFFTQSMGYLNDLGFVDVNRLVRWKTKFVTGLMTTPDTCWLFATNYSFNVKLTETGSLFTTYKQMYDDSVGNIVNPTSGTLLKDQPCISPQMQAWRPKIYGRTMGIREMLGYPDDATGYGANMQPALAYAVDIGYPGAKDGWNTYETRDPSQKTIGEYGAEPQFSIVPRSIPQTSIQNGYSIIINRPDLPNPNPITPKPPAPPIVPPVPPTDIPPPNIPPGGTLPPGTPPPPNPSTGGTVPPSVPLIPMKQIFLIK